MMKVFIVLNLIAVGTLAVPYHINRNHIDNDDSESLSNSIEDDHMGFLTLNNSLLGPSEPIQYPSAVNLYKYILASARDGDMRSIIRSIMKPLLTSVEFQILVDFVDESLRLFTTDPRVKAMIRNSVDSLQELYRSSDSELAKNLLTWLVSQYSDEETARSFSSLMSDITPTLESWVIEPMRKYYRSYITPTVGYIYEAMTALLVEDESENALARSGRWSDFTELYIARLSDMMSEAKTVLHDTAKFLELQDVSLQKDA